MIVDVVAFSDRAARDRAADVRAFVAVWFEAQALWAAEPQKAAAVIARITGETGSVEVSGCKLLDLKANILAFQDGDSCPSLYHVGIKQIEFLVEQGYLSQRPDLWRILDSSFLPGRGAGS
jgi:ABC-type nitrate/sulfonate/bicarbonate transport system substrate-binding protein